MTPIDHEDVYLTPDELADRWRMDVRTLANQRHRGEGLQHVKLPSGKILYRLADVLTAEREGYRGLSVREVCAEIMKCDGVSPDLLRRIATQVERRFLTPV